MHPHSLSNCEALILMSDTEERLLAQFSPYPEFLQLLQSEISSCDSKNARDSNADSIGYVQHGLSAYGFSN
ncbi:hypothetical protein HII13_004219 [Brettanomyces bruxellensis]|nr:hypothetical protein HII13_004219 [Brettanomyces bruxellensis]